MDTRSSISRARTSFTLKASATVSRSPAASRPFRSATSASSGNVGEASLAIGQAPNGKHVMRARDRALYRRVVLVVDHYVPQPDRDAGSRYHVVLHSRAAAVWRGGQVLAAQSVLQPGLLPKRCRISAWRSCTVATTAAFDAWLAENGGDVDAALLSRPQVASICMPILRRHGGMPLLYYGHDLHFRRMRQRAEAQDDARLAREADRMERLERAVWRAVDITLYPSDEETAIVDATGARRDRPCNPAVLLCRLRRQPRTPDAEPVHAVRRRFRPSAQSGGGAVVRRRRYCH